jgi:hypothetical protein
MLGTSHPVERVFVHAIVYPFGVSVGLRSTIAYRYLHLPAARILILMYKSGFVVSALVLVRSAELAKS